jgi:hypothetical protein
MAATDTIAGELNSLAAATVIDSTGGVLVADRGAAAQPAVRRYRTIGWIRAL